MGFLSFSLGSLVLRTIALASITPLIAALASPANRKSAPESAVMDKASET
jgi:hypothetical protein